MKTTYRLSYSIGDKIIEKRNLSEYDLNNIIEYMKENWNLEPCEINVFFEEKKK